MNDYIIRTKPYWCSYTIAETKGDSSVGVIAKFDEVTGVMTVLTTLDEHGVGLVAKLVGKLKALEKRISELERKPNWINHCDKTAPAALRFLAENQRPIGGSSSYNREHLYDIAREIEITANSLKGE